MNKSEHPYLWYPLTNFVRRDNSDFYFFVPKKLSPYIELNTESLTRLRYEIEAEKNKRYAIEINPFIKYAKEFHEISHAEYWIFDIHLRELMMDMMLHTLGQLELYTGQNKKDIIVKEIVRGIKEGHYGEKTVKLFECFKEYEKYIIADILYESQNKITNTNTFKLAIKQIFEDSAIYDNKYSGTNLVLYLNYPKSRENQDKIKLILEFFMPIILEIDIFWEKHFGVIGNNITMKINEIVMF